MLTLVTGPTGYLGSLLVAELRARDRRVRAMVRTETAAVLLQSQGVETVIGDVTDTATLPAALDGVDTVFHMAGVVGHRASDDDRLQSVNVDGARNLLTAAIRSEVGRVVFTSSVAAVGPASTPSRPRDEHAFMIHGDDGRPDFRYARSKALGELEAIKAAENGLDVVIVNPGFVIGPGDVNRVSSWPIEEYLRGRLRFTVTGGLSYVDARDVVAGHLLAEEKGVAGERYILTDDKGNLSHAEFFARVGRVCNKRRFQVHMPVGMLIPAVKAGTALHLPLPLDAEELRSSARWWYYTAAKAREQLGFTVRPLDDSIRDTAEWLKQDGYRKH